MLRLATNVSLNERGRRRTELSLDETRQVYEPDSSAETDPEARLMDSEAKQSLHGALQKLQSNHRAAIVLHDFEGLSYEEAAEALETSEGTARQWAHRGRQKLKDLLS